MIDRDQLRRKKQKECDDRVTLLHGQVPRLGEIHQTLGELAFGLMRTAVIQHDPGAIDALSQQFYTLTDEKRGILARLGIAEAFYEPDWDCPFCEDRGYTEPGVLCNCYLQERLAEYFAMSGIPPVMKTYTFANFDVNHYEMPQDMAEKVERVKGFAEGVIAGTQKTNMVFLGKVGRGKTHLSVAVANHVLAGGKSVIYKRIDDLMDLIRRYKFEQDARDGTMALELSLLTEADLLIIDDLGSEVTSEFVVNQLRRIIEDRNLQDRPWIINTNLAINDISTYYDARLADRIIEKATIFEFVSSESIRMRLRKENKDLV